MLTIEKSENKQLLTELSLEVAANINGGQGEQGGQGGGEQSGGGQSGKSSEGKFNYSKYLQALGIAYLSPPEVGTITDKEALLAQYQGWDD